MVAAYNLKAVHLNPRWRRHLGETSDAQDGSSAAQTASQKRFPSHCAGEQTFAGPCFSIDTPWIIAQGSYIRPLSKAQICLLQQCILCFRFQHEFKSSSWHQRRCQQISLVLKWMGFAFCAIVALHISSLPLWLLLFRIYFILLSHLYIITKRRWDSSALFGCCFTFSLFPLRLLIVLLTWLAAIVPRKLQLSLLP